MSTVFACPSCGRQIKSSVEYAGKSVRCPKCKDAIQVPKITAITAAQPPRREPKLPRLEKPTSAWTRARLSVLVAGSLALVGIVGLSIKALAPRGNANVLRAQQALERGDYDLALACLNEALPGDPKNADLYHDRGRAFFGKKSYELAIADFTEGIRLRPNSGVLYRRRANSYSSRGDMDRALADFAEALRLDPGDKWAYFKRALAYVLHPGTAGGADSVRLALADFDSAIRLDPEFFEAFEQRASLYFNAFGDFRLKEVIADASKAISLKPEPPPAFLYSIRGQALWKSGQRAEGYADLEKAATFDPMYRDGLKSMRELEELQRKIKAAQGP
jgi:tetratricopeptide (TPR) repeat protein/DNA-directed RNA polymerase subunit RPC12/RpoP